MTRLLIATLLALPACWLIVRLACSRWLADLLRGATVCALQRLRARRAAGACRRGIGHARITLLPPSGVTPDADEYQRARPVSDCPASRLAGVR